MGFQSDQRADQRSAQRKRLLKGGVIAYSGRQMTMACVVRDISETGARLQVSKPQLVPDTFDLLIELDGTEAVCEVVRRGATELGVRFMAPVHHAAPTRSQVVAISDQQVHLRALTQSVVRSDRRPVGAIQTQATAKPAAPQRAVVMPAKPPVATAPVAKAASTAPTSPARAAAAPGIHILVAEDDPDDRLMLASAFKEAAYRHSHTFVRDGEDLLRYLRAEAPYADRKPPGIVVLDLNMPRMDGRAALKVMKTDAKLRRLPVIVLTTSNADDDVECTHELGVAAYMTKPNSYDGLVEMARAIDQYWLARGRLPRLEA